MSLDALMGKLRALHAEAPDRRLVLKADGSLRYDAVRRVFLRIQDEGLTGCSLQVSQKKGPSAPEAE
jgi:biopolymer transport protein ExbD